MTENAIAKEIVDAAFRIHTAPGPGLLESVYHAVLAYELAQCRLRTVSQQAIPVVYGTIRIDIGFRADLIVEDRVIVEIKSVEAIAPVHKKQLLTYLRLADKRLWPADQLPRGAHQSRMAFPVSSMDWKKTLAQSRKDAKNTSEATGFEVSSV
jgi:GxxExxY protein